MRCNARYLLVVATYLFCAAIVFLQYYYVEQDYRENHQWLEDTPIDCQPIYEGTEDAKKYQGWHIGYEFIERELINNDVICEDLHKYFNFQKTPLSSEEKKFPLAFGMLVHANFVQVAFVQQVLSLLSLMYQPQNHYCVSIDNMASNDFKNVLMKIPRCFENIRVQIGDYSIPQHHKMGVLNNVYNCLPELALPGKEWEYFQFVMGHDMPLKTNLEMVRILKALNGSINTDIEPFSTWRYGIRRSLNPPLPLYQGGLSVVLPRAAADYLVGKKAVENLLIYLEKTHAPFDSFWSTLAANKQLFPVPGSVHGRDIISLKKQFKDKELNEEISVSYVGQTSIGKYDIGHQHGCPWCHYTIPDVPKLLTRPEIFAHKVYMDLNQAMFICLAKEVRQRSLLDEQPFEASSYSQMPTVELANGKSTAELTRPEWIQSVRKSDEYQS